MLTIVICAFVGSMLFNFFVILFGTKDIEALKARMASGGSYLKEVNDALVDGLGDQAATLLKLLLTVAAIIFLIYHLVTAVLALLAVALGTWAAKRAYKVPAVSNVLRRIATYINRLRG